MKTNKQFMVLVDYGKPETFYLNTETQLINKLKELKNLLETKQVFYYDFFIYAYNKSKGGYIDISENEFIGGIIRGLQNE